MTTRGLTPGDTRVLLRLSRTVHTAGDPVTRKKVLLAGMCSLLEAESGLGVVAHVERAPRRHTIVSVTRHGPSHTREEQLLGRCLPALDTVASGNSADPDPHWHHLVWPPRPTGSSRMCHCIRYSVPIYDAHVIACVSLSRSQTGAKPFGAHERMLLHLAHMELSWVYETDLLLATHGAVTLSPRQRQTLEYLLGGLGEKQIASRMRLSQNTVHHHIKAIHRHFGVCSRSELLAKWVR